MAVLAEETVEERIDRLAPVKDGEVFTYKEKPVYDFFKRVFDLLFSVLATVVLSPLLLIITACVFFEDFHNPFYLQERIKKNHKTFKIIKFRSMKPNADKLIDQLPDELRYEYQHNFKIDNDPRITRIGRVIRRTSLDELPQLINIIKGDISLIGPRPILEEETRMYGENAELLLSVKPGLTGYWQAYSREQISYDNGDRQRIELYYVSNRSFSLDVKIFFKTIGTVLRRTGAK